MAKHVREVTTSLWMETAEVSRHQSLSTDVEADVCIVGAGIAGLTTAYQLASEGRYVVVLDDGPVAGGQTQRTSAHLSNAIDDRYTEIEKLHGEEAHVSPLKATRLPLTESKPSRTPTAFNATSAAWMAICSWHPAILRTCWSRNEKPPTGRA